MKNPIKHIKHMLKDPINTIDEANARKKEIMPWFIASVAIGAGFGILDGILSTGFLMIVALVGIFGAMFFGFLLFIIKKAKEKFEALTCDKCNTMATLKTLEEYNEFVSWTASKNEAKYHGVSHPSSNDGIVSEVKASASATVAVSIDLKCPHCSNVKKLIYTITPFKCEAKQKKVPVLSVEGAKANLERAVKEVVADYNDLEKRAEIPYSIHSVNHPNFEERGKAHINEDKVHPLYNGVRIMYRKDVEEMVEAFFIHNQLDGTISDPNKPKKDKKSKK